MRVLVTGGAGYIGSVTTAALLERGHHVVVVDDLRTGHAAAVPAGARLIRAAVADRAQMVAALTEEGIEAVVHFAADSLVGESMADPLKYYRHNVSGASSLLEAVLQAGVKRFVFSSSAAVYGTPAAVPIPEDAALAPESVYGETKLVVERLLGWLVRTKGLGFVALRYFNAAGAAPERGELHEPETHLIPLVLQVAAGVRPHISVFGDDYPTADGTAVRDYVHVLDLASAHVLAVEAALPGEGRIYNLGSGRGYSVREVIDVCRQVTGHAIPEVMAPRRAGDPPVLVADATRAKEQLGWQPGHDSLREMVESAWRFMQNNPNGYPR